MARYKHYNYEQTKLLPVRYSDQILPGTFEFTLNYVIDELDLRRFDARYRNDTTGAPAYDPRILLKIILFAYSRGILSSRRIESLCRENVVMMALSADTQPDFTTISDFVSTSSEAIVTLFREVLLVCEALGLLGKELFAIDGVKLPSNAAKEWSGKKTDLKKKQQKIEKVIRTLLARHRENDATEAEAPSREREEKSLERPRAKVRKIKAFLATNRLKGPGSNYFNSIHERPAAHASTSIMFPCLSCSAATIASRASMRVRLPQLPALAR
jgi:transposase